MTGNRGGVRHLPMRRGEDERRSSWRISRCCSKLVGEPAFTDLETRASSVTIDWYRRLPADESTMSLTALSA